MNSETKALTILSAAPFLVVGAIMLLYGWPTEIELYHEWMTSCSIPYWIQWDIAAFNWLRIWGGVSTVVGVSIVEYSLDVIARDYAYLDAQKKTQWKTLYQCQECDTLREAEEISE